MKRLIALEELAMFLCSGLALYYLQVQWWWYILLLLGPDIGFIGYLGGNKVGAITYNIFHHKGIAIAIIITSFFISIEWADAFLFTGIILFGHSSMDRFFGYGLKLFEGFKYTHLGQIGNNKI